MLQKLLATHEDFRASETGKGFGEITGKVVCRMINPGWTGPGRARGFAASSGLQDLAQKAILKCVLWMRFQSEGGADH